MRQLTRYLPRSLRSRLVLWNGLILAVALVAFGGAVYAILAHSLSTQIRQSLAERANQVNAAVEQRALSPRFRRNQNIEVPPPNTFASADTFVQIATVEGEVLGTSFNSGRDDLPLDEATLDAVRSGRPLYSTRRLGRESVAVYSAPISVGGRVVGVVQVGRSLGFVEGALSNLRFFAGLGLLAALLLSVLGASMMAGRTLRPLERLIRTAESIGSSRDLSRRVEPPSSDDEVGRLAVTFNGMLSRLQSSDAQLRETLDAQRRFVADASHELRTPLTTIRGNAGMLRQVAEMTPEDRAEALAQIHGEAERMSRLVGELLTLARADGGFVLRREPVDLASLVDEVAAQARLLAGSRRVDVNVPDRLVVTGDPDALRQVALILLENAIKYTEPDDRIEVRLELRYTEACLTVTDTGVGIDAEHLPRIFDRFYRADPARSSGGTGLGLSIARWIVEQHGGRIEVETTPGKGSTFAVHLPRSSSDAAGEAAPVRRAPSDEPAVAMMRTPSWRPILVQARPENGRSPIGSSVKSTPPGSS